MAKDQPKQSKSTKAERIKALLLHSTGATIAEMASSTDWKSHGVRGFMSRTLKKKLGFEVTSKTQEGKPRGYFIARGEA